jgi:hypothetical protein
MKNLKRLFLRTYLLFFISFCISVFVGCADNAQWSVYSVEILINKENNQAFCAQVGEEFNVSITVNDYEESYKFKIFYAWIDYDDEKIELTYGDNLIALD